MAVPCRSYFKSSKCKLFILASFLQGERLYDFLERQVGDQMRTALKEPLHNISDNILNRVISKSI